ncbi:AAA family ATPase [Candidatus Nomurabacteria bacterium]|nr:AAA family ATPase [Candidatus Nomurabacteria bacterium]
MNFTLYPKLRKSTCSHCKGAGAVHNRKCPSCHGYSVAIGWKKHILYYGQPLSRYMIAVKKGRRIMHTVQFLIGLLFFLTFLGMFFYIFTQSPVRAQLFTLSYWVDFGGYAKWMVGIALFFLLYFVYKMIAWHRKVTPIAQVELADVSLVGQEFESIPDDWHDILAHKKREFVDISQSFTDEVVKIVEDAYFYADKYNAKEVTPVHMFYSLLHSYKVRSVFIRIGFPADALYKALERSFVKETVECVPVVSDDVQDILYYAYFEAVHSRQKFIHVTELLLATIYKSESLQSFLYELGVGDAKLKNVVEWVRIQEYISQERMDLVKMASTRNKYGLDRAMTAVATPYLNSFSQDLTMQARYGNLPPCVARSKEIDEIFRVVEGGRSNVILVGETGVGKMSIIEGIAQRMVEEKVPGRLGDKRLVQLSVSSLLAGTTISGAQERLIRIMHEVSRAGNIILFINHLHDLIHHSGAENGMDVSKTLAEYLQAGNFFVFSTSTTQGYNKHIMNSAVSKVFTRVLVEEVDENQAIQILESKVPYLEYKLKAYFSYNALENSVKLARRFLHDQYLPENAIELLTEAGSLCKAENGPNSFVSAEHVARVVSDKTGVPATSITQEESEKLLTLESELHKRVIGQERAVELVSSALRRARAEVRSLKRPIANFLFLGPTGVGKTELAKTIAEVYFGQEERMIRIDMSEFQDKSAIHRLIGSPGQQGTGLLTEAVRLQPFSLVLFDELEKADPDILNLFLQVFDDGHLTDSVGRKIDFTNAIIIATSNAGTSYVQQALGQGRDIDTVLNEIIHGELQKYYRPEFLNRFDGIVLFKPLDRKQIKQIAGLMIAGIAKNLDEQRGIALKVNDETLEMLCETGYNPEFGARPMRRAVQDMIENKIADLLLKNEVQRNDAIVFCGKSGVRVEHT